MTSLKQLVERDGPLDYRRAARFVEDVAAQLGELHARDVLHRDLRPAVLILDETGRVELQLSHLGRHESRTALYPLIDECSALEVADYLAPEQALNGYKADARADIYSLGCTFYFLLTGHSPFPEGSISERLLKHQVAKAASITGERANAPVTLVQLCEGMMSKNREDRPQTATEVASILRAWLADQDAA
jgi:serine/threonine-protein kinase